MMKRVLGCGALSAVVMLTGCATPKQQCISQATQELRSTENALETAQANVARGYAVHTQRVPYTVSTICYRTHPGTHAAIPYSCPTTQFRTQTTPVAIDVAEERRKIEEFQRLLPQLRDVADVGVGQCNAQFPE